MVETINQAIDRIPTQESKSYESNLSLYEKKVWIPIKAKSGQ